jgi:hypothetical protein
MADSSGPPGRGKGKEFQFNVGKTAAVGCLLMVLVSGYTTAKGLLDIVGGSQFYIVILATVVVQGTLAIAAWFLGQELARFVLRRRLGPGMDPPSGALTAVTAALFLATFSVSVFFSFSFWFTELRGLSQRREDARQLPNTFVSEVMPTLLAAVNEGRMAELRGVSEFPATKEWLANLDKIVDFARDKRQAVQKQIEENAGARNMREKQVRDARAKLTQFRTDKERYQREADVIDKKLAPFDEELAQLQKEWQQYEQERLAECAGIQGRKQGCGPKATEATKQRDAVKRRMDEIESTLQGDRKRRAQLARLLQSAQADTEDLARFLEKSSNAPSEAGTSAGGLDTLEQMVTLLTQRQRAFREAGTRDTYGEVVQTCGSIVGLFTEAKLTGGPIENLSCESVSVLALTESRPQREAARLEFTKDCSPSGMTRVATEAISMIPSGGERVKDDILSGAFEHVNGKIQACVNLAIATGADVSVAERKRSDFARLHAPNRDRFQEALAGLFEGGAQRTAALALATTFDMIILALSFFADVFNIRGHARGRSRIERQDHVDASPHPDDSVPLAGAKALRRYVRFDRKLMRSVVDLNAPGIAALDPNIRENLLMRVDRFIEGHLADVVDDSRYALSEEAIAEIEEYIHRRATMPSADAARASTSTPPDFNGEQRAPEYDSAPPARQYDSAAPVRQDRPDGRTISGRPRANRAADFGAVNWQRQQRPVQPPAAPARQAESERNASANKADFGIASLLGRRPGGS